MIHAVVAQPYTTTLIIRGPAVKDRFLLTDRATGRSWWQHGAATESTQAAAQKQLPLPRLLDRLDDLHRRGVLA
jgi:hypothetical protein